MNNREKPQFIFFGTPSFAVGVLDELEKYGFPPSLVVTTKDKPRGRKLIVTPPEVKVWAKKRNIPILQPEKLDDVFVSRLKMTACDVFVVVAYGKILPKEILALPKYGTLNVHPSLLPRLRGASPIQSAILTEEKTGVSIILLDEEMDHGPIVVQKELSEITWPPKAGVLEKALAELGGQMLAEILTKYIAGEIITAPQDHSKATFTKKIQKEDGLLDLAGDAKQNFRKIQAFHVWPRAYFFHKTPSGKSRVIITDAELENGELLIKKVLPEGEKEISYKEFLQQRPLHFC